MEKRKIREGRRYAAPKRLSKTGAIKALMFRALRRKKAAFAGSYGFNRICEEHEASTN